MKALDKPFVSIITPTYNRADYLPETISSILDQSYTNMEYIILDDGSTDSTRQLLDRYQTQLRWETHTNIGEARTVNKGFSMVQGEIIGVVNSDDPIMPELVEYAVQAFRANPELLVVYPDWLMIDQDSNIVKEMCAPDYDYLRMVRHHQCFIGPGAFIRKKALTLETGRDPSYRYVGDFEYWHRIGLHGPFKRIPEILAKHRVHSVSASAEHGEAKAEEHMRLVSEFFNRRDLPEEVQDVKQEAFSNAAYLAARTLMPSSPYAARKYFLNSLKFDPFSYMKWRPSRLFMLLASFMPPKIANLVRRLAERMVRSTIHYYDVDSGKAEG